MKALWVSCICINMMTSCDLVLVNSASVGRPTLQQSEGAAGPEVNAEELEPNYGAAACHHLPEKQSGARHTFAGPRFRKAPLVLLF